MALLEDERSSWRYAGVRLAAAALAPDTWLPTAADPSPDVRHAAVAKLIAAHWLPDDVPRKPADYGARVRDALYDPASAVRLAAAGSVYPDMERNVIVALMIAATANEGERTALRWALMSSDDWELTRWDITSFAGADVRQALIGCLADPDPKLRRYALKRIDLRVAASDDDEDMTDFITAVFERLLVERDLDLIYALLRFDGYTRIPGTIIERLTALAPDVPTTFNVAYFLRQFGLAAVPLLKRLASDGTAHTADEARLSLAAIGGSTV
ncbi:MAG: hypothetical protein SH859_02520 [Hyphomicrobium aestuarii]|nr:hypothetical protein [Hyphomicrobium aestuarii]